MGRDGRAGRFLQTWREDDTYKALTSAAASFGCTALFALYHGYLGFRYGSLWHGSAGGFYLLLMAIRGSILLTERRSRRMPEARRDLCRRRAFGISAGLLLVLDLVLAVPVTMMAALDKPVSMGLIPAIAMAAYTTWKITMASIRLSRQRRRPGGSILVAELRTVNFIDALVSILTLQNTLIMVNGTEQGTDHMLPLSAASSAVIYAAIVGVTLRLLWRGLAGRSSLSAALTDAHPERYDYDTDTTL